jgi:hypothetical protein
VGEDRTSPKRGALGFGPQRKRWDEFIWTPEQHQARAAVLRLMGRDRLAQQHEMLARAIDLRRQEERMGALAPSRKDAFARAHRAVAEVLTAAGPPRPRLPC